MDEKQKEIKKKSASGIWVWIFCLLFASAVILVVISMFGNYIRYVLTGKPDPRTAVYPEEGGPMGVVIAVPLKEREPIGAPLKEREPIGAPNNTIQNTISPGSDTW